MASFAGPILSGADDADANLQAAAVDQFGNFTGALHVVAISERGIQCATPDSLENPFWLPLEGSYVNWVQPPRIGKLATAIIPNWLAAKHRQLVGDGVFERVRDNERNIERDKMQDKFVDAGNGALFKNTKKEKPSHPDYRGDCTLRGSSGGNGKKFLVSAWVKEGKNGRYLSLGFRPAPADEVQQTSVSASVPDDDPLF